MALPAHPNYLTFVDAHQLSDLTVQIEPMVRLVFIYDNEGRCKSVVTRNLSTDSKRASRRDMVGRRFEQPKANPDP